MARYNESMRFIFPLALTLLILPSVAFAQFLGGDALDESTAFSASIDPQYPAPYTNATLSVLSASLDLANATMKVSVNKKQIYSGSVQDLSIRLGGAGNMTKIDVTISSSGKSYTQNLSVQPQDVVLVAEPLSSAPPLYPGKTLVPLEGSVRVVAMANLRDTKGKAIDPATLSYSWTVDETSLSNASGIGKSAIIVDSPFKYRSTDVSVSIKSQDGSLVGGDSLSLVASDPVIRVYENDPLLGIVFNRAISGNYKITSSEDSLYAAPFSMPTSSGLPVIQWFLNGDLAQTGKTITLRPTGSGQGSASLSLIASSGESTRATQEFSLSFGAIQSSVLNKLFGL